MRTETFDGNISIYGSTNSNSLELVGCELANGSFTVDTLKNRVAMTPKAGVVYAVDTNKDRMAIMKAGSFTPQATLSSYNYRTGYGWDTNAYDTYYGTTANADDSSSVLGSSERVEEWLKKEE